MRSSLLSTLLLAGFAACGRTDLDDPVSETGAGGASTGAAGAPGNGGASGSPIGEGGASGSVVDASTSEPPPATDASASDLGVPGVDATCVEGDTQCAGNEVQTCQNGAWVSAFGCPVGCLRGVCTECVPGATQCASATQEQVCTADGIWSPSMLCAGACTNGACPTVECTENDTRCASHEAQQTCVNGAWASATSCEYVCVDKACGINTKNVFVTSQTFMGGSLQGLTGADSICEKLANDAGLMGIYLAWLSDATGSPATRFTEDGGPYQLVDGTEIAHNWTGLTESGLINGITATELKTMPPAGTSGCDGPSGVWTDTRSDGTLNDVRFSCDDWSNVMGMGAALGVAGGALGWTDACMQSIPTTTAPCAAFAALYCFEQ